MSSTPAADTGIQDFDGIVLDRRPLSPLTYRIMALNIVPVFILVLGLIYLGQYRNTLINAESEAFKTETLLAQGILSDYLSNTEIKKEKIKNLITLLGSNNKQLFLYNDEGRLIADLLSGPQQKEAEKQDNVPPFFESLTSLFLVEFNLPSFPLFDVNNLNTFPSGVDALNGQMTVQGWSGTEKGLILSALMPITEDNKTKATLLVIKSDTQMEKTFSNLKKDVLRLFVICLLMTISISLYISSVIGHPLRQLALAAEKIRKEKKGVIPDLSARRDEIGELSSSMRDMTEALNARMNSIDRFAADVAHELKNPLTSIRSAVETLQKIKKDEDRQKLEAIIMHDLVRMDRLISDISATSRLDAELSRDVPVKLSAQKLLSQIVAQYRMNLRGNQQLKLMAPADELFIKGHESRLAQVFQNLIENALSFLPDDGEIIVSIKDGENFATLSVEDTGPGISDGKLDQIFERFYTQRPDTESFGAHSGLGLSIVKQIITALGGRVYAENNIDEAGNKKGARFIVRLLKATQENET